MRRSGRRQYGQDGQEDQITDKQDGQEGQITYTKEQHIIDSKYGREEDRTEEQDEQKEGRIG